MNISVLNRSTGNSGLLNTANGENRLSLYDKYGGIAYGVILQIIPQPQHAQEVLVDLFASPELQTNLPFSARTSCTIIRMARDKALDYRQKQQIPVPISPVPARQSELIFNLLFYQNQTPESIAERLKIQRSEVFGAIRDFFA